MKTLELHPAYAPAHEWFGDTCEKAGMQSEAITQWASALTLSGDPEQARIFEQTYAAEGFDAAVRAAAQKKLDRLNERAARGEYISAYHYLMTCVRLGDYKQAFVWLGKAVDERSWFALETRLNPVLDPLRNDPSFEPLVQKPWSNR